MPNAFFITLIFIILTTVIGAFLKGRSKDRCLKDFKGYIVSLQTKENKIITGTLEVESSGIEFIYAEEFLNKNLNAEKSSMFYKNEFSIIVFLARYHDMLSLQQSEKRKHALKKYYRSKPIYLFLRKIRNFLYTVKDALMDITSLLVGRMKAATPMGSVLSGQDKYSSQLQQQIIMPSVRNFEPLLEKYIGRKVILRLNNSDEEIEYKGVLKDYTADFIEILDVDCIENNKIRKADLIISRQFGIVRHLSK